LLRLTLEAARLGQGVALVSDLICWDRLKSGELVEVIPSDIQMGGYYFVAPTTKWIDPALTVIRRWLAATLAAPAAKSTSRDVLLLLGRQRNDSLQLAQ